MFSRKSARRQGRFGCWAAFLFFVAAWAGPAAAAPPSSDILPATTRQYLSIGDVKSFADGWNRAALSRLFADADMKAVLDQVNLKGVDGLELGLDWAALQTVGGGEACWAMVQSGPKSLARLLILNVTGKDSAAGDLLAALEVRLAKAGYAASSQAIAGATVHVYTVADKKGSLAYALKDDLLVCGDSLPVIEDVLARLQSGAKDSLTQYRPFQETQRLAKEKLEGPGTLCFYVDPVSLAEALRAGSAKPRKGRDMAKILKKEGFDAIKGVGGVVTFGTEKYEAICHAAVYAPPPYQKSMRMLRFLAGKDFTPPAWVPADLGSCGIVHLDVQNAFETFASLFDAIYGEGDEGTFADVITGLRDDPDGPKVDVAKELIAQLGTKLTVVTDTLPALGPYSERRLIAVEARGEKALAAALRRLLANDEEVELRTFKGVDVWAIPPQKKKKVPGQPDVPAPHSAVAVAQGHLFVATHVDFLEKVLAMNGAPLTREDDYGQVVKETAAIQTPAPAVRWFARTDQDLRTLYDALRRHVPTMSQSLYGQILHSVLPGLGTDSIDLQKLPDFERVQPYLGPVGAIVVNTDSGWLITAFALRKQP